MTAAAQRLEAPAQTEGCAIDVSRPAVDVPIDQALKTIITSSGKGYSKVVREYIELAFGPGKVSFKDYVRLRLFDDEFYAGSDKKAVIGQRRNRDIAAAVNYRKDWLAVLANKVASRSYLASYGLPTIPFSAIYGENLEIKAPLVVRNTGELREFLLDERHYPLFGKPIEAFQSLGTIALRRPLAAEDRLERTDGTTVPLDDVVADISAHYAKGYLFQTMVSPHPVIRDLCGDRLATARMVTIGAENGPRLFRACWKIPAGRNAADNYWRSGNLLGQIEVATGRILRVMSGAGVELTSVTDHPDTGRRLVDAVLPNWDAMIATALAGAKLMQHMPMIGWDIASTASGPVIVEMNETPDLFLNQLADGKGALEPDFLAFIEFQERNAKAHERQMRSTIQKL